MTFEHRHENKSCSACRDRVNERVKVAKVVKVKVFQVFQNIPGSQLLSDIQTFFYLTKVVAFKARPRDKPPPLAYPLTLVGDSF